jgi:serine phosphatase RsbU (regulator of sigma subunit)
MSIGSHKDAFKAYQFVKKLTGKAPAPNLANLAADILLDFVKNRRQINPDFMLEKLPDDRTVYDEEKLTAALEAVEALCGKCNENHHNACFINQARRILIAAETGIDLGSDFDGKKSLSHLLKQAADQAARIPKHSVFCPPDIPCKSAVPPISYDELKRKYEALREKDIFRATLIDEIVDTIRSVSEGNFEAEMPVHDDPQLGQLATAFNIMLGTVGSTMAHLDALVADRTSELNASNEKLQKLLQKQHQTNIRLNKSLEDVEEANKKITDSIQYAKMIQQSLLPNPENIRTLLPESFFIWMPKDIVGGDFIFTEYIQDRLILAVVDCTGHGVPGAFMTMIASSGLKKIIRDEGWHDPALILKRLNFFVKTTLHQDTDHALSDDGLDVGIVSCELSVVSGGLSAVSGKSSAATRNSHPATHTPQLHFAGARIPLVCVHNREVKIIQSDRESIGYKKSDLKYNFTNYTVSVENGMSFYMATDGFISQLGGERGRPFGSRRFRELLKNVSEKSPEEQRNILLQRFEEWQKDYNEDERQDDVTVVGFRLR